MQLHYVQNDLCVIHRKTVCLLTGHNDKQKAQFCLVSHNYYPAYLQFQNRLQFLQIRCY